MQGIIKKASFAAIALSVVAQAKAQTQNQLISDWSLQVQLESLYDNNAFRLPENNDGTEDRVTEQQNNASLGISGAHYGNLNTVSLNYRANYNQFTKDSRESDSNFFGDSSYTFGNENTYYGLDVQHSITQVLVAPDQDFVAQNARERQEFLVSPKLKTRSSLPDSFWASGIFSRVVYESDFQSDADQAGFSAGWLHRMPRVYQFGVTYTDTENTFNDNEALDYEYRRAEAFFSGATRYLQYRLSVGSQEIEDNTGETSNSPYRDISVSYNNFGSSFSYAETFELTDTSFQGGIFNQNNGVGFGGEENTQDRIELTSRQLSWQTGGLCKLCDLSLSYARQQSNYLSLDESDFETEILQASFAYNYSRRSSVGLRFSSQNVEFENDPGRDTETDIIEFNYGFSFGIDNNVSVFVRHRERETVADPYSSEIAGIRFGKTFN